MKLKLIISKRIFDGKSFIMLGGHKPNSNFKNVVTGGESSYENAYHIAHCMANALILAGNAVKIYNDPWTMDNGNAFCDRIAALGLA